MSGFYNHIKMLGASLIGRRKSTTSKGRTLTEEEIKGKGQSVDGDGEMGCRNTTANPSDGLASHRHQHLLLKLEQCQSAVMWRAPEMECSILHSEGFGSGL
ncbi:hypothetical protein pipiens_009887 [Culex pipiens pipiens]|uniref:Uncharacterized protein n=1 Tax=Culex pipiens pipiens TaxID=38569 RepID=A0ABD1DCU9_CULPP